MIRKEKGKRSYTVSERTPANRHPATGLLMVFLALRYLKVRMVVVEPQGWMSTMRGSLISIAFPSSWW